MAGAYRIAARPEIEDGMLVSVAFMAESASSRREWSTRNCGQFPFAFARIMPREVARLLLASLEAGDQVEFPGSYIEDQFDYEFAFEWSPVQFLRPPQFVEPGRY